MESVAEVEIVETKKSGYTESGGLTPEQKSIQDKIDRLNRTLSSPATSDDIKEDIKNKISTLETAMEKENEKIANIEQERKEQEERDRLESIKREKEEKIKNRFKGQFYIDIADDINRQTFRKKLWQSGLRYKGKESGKTLRIILDNNKDIDKVYKIYKSLLEKEKMDIPKLDSISGVFKRSGIAKSKLK